MSQAKNQKNANQLNQADKMSKLKLPPKKQIHPMVFPMSNFFVCF